MATYDTLRDIANQTPAQRRNDRFPSPDALRAGRTEVDGVQRADAEPTRFLYASLNRPLGMWFDPPAQHVVLGGTRRMSVAGTAVPLGPKVLADFELTPYDEKSRAASLLEAWNGEDRLGAALGDGRGVMVGIRFLCPGGEEEAGPTVIECREDGSRQADQVFPKAGEAVREARRRAAMRLVEGDWELVPVSIAADQAERWGALETATAWKEPGEI